MSVLTVRGGIPRVYRMTIDETGVGWDFQFTTNWLKIRASTNPVRMYFTEDDYDNDEAYVLVPEGDRGWEGPAEADKVWLRCPVGGSTSEVEMIAFQRRG